MWRVPCVSLLSFIEFSQMFHTVEANECYHRSAFLCYHRECCFKCGYCFASCHSFVYLKRCKRSDECALIHYMNIHCESTDAIVIYKWKWEKIYKYVICLFGLIVTVYDGNWANANMKHEPTDLSLIFIRLLLFLAQFVGIYSFIVL